LFSRLANGNISGKNDVIAVVFRYQGVGVIKVLLVDDHQVVRVGLRHLLSEVKQVEVVGEAENGEKAWSLIANSSLEIDVVPMDIHMPKMGGFETTRRLLRKYPKVKIIILTASTSNLYPYHLLHVGAKGYVTKDCELDELVKAIETVNRGKVYFSSKITAQLMQENTSPFYALSPIEMQIVLLLIENEPISEIAKRLCLSPKTVSTYRHRILKKVGAKNNVELVQLAAKEGLLDVPNF